MEAFITLTTDDKEAFHLNTRHIIGVLPHKKGSVVTIIVPLQTWGINQLNVTETPDEVMGKITRSNLNQ